MQYGQMLEDIKHSPLNKQVAIKRYAFVKIERKFNYFVTEIGKDSSPSNTVRISPKSFERYIRPLTVEQCQILGLLYE